MSNLIDKIADGTAVLLSAEDICKRLSVSRSTFDRWVKNGSSSMTLADMLEMTTKKESSFLAPRKNRLIPEAFLEESSSYNDDKLSFPPADIRIGNSPRWSIETFKGWLLKQSTKL